MFNAFESFMLWSPKNNCYTLLLENISLYFILQHVFFIHFFLFPSSYALFHTFISECDCTSLEFFYKEGIQLNKQLTLSCLKHSTHCRSIVCPYQALDRRPAKERIGCSEHKKIKRHWNIQLVYKVLSSSSSSLAWQPFISHSLP
jgi:hypothetical protein